MTNDQPVLEDESESRQAALLFSDVVKRVSEQAGVRVEGREVPLFFPRGIDQISLSFVVGKATISLNISGVTCCKAGVLESSATEAVEVGAEGLLEADAQP